MTKLVEWLTGLAVVVALWVAILNGSLFPSMSKDHRDLALFWPVVGVGAFGIYCVSVIAYRVATFNDCDEAAAELQEEIKEAKEDLKKKGIKL